jgi:RimJ/RimL family protein N-acetyltransferase
LAPAHAAELLAPLASPSLYAWFEDDVFESAEALAAGWIALARMLRERHDIARLSWVVRERATARAVGKLDVQLRERVASNVGWVFFPGARGRGLAAESVRLLCEHLAAGGIPEQRAYVTAGNVDSVRVALRAGFTPARVFRGGEQIRGLAYDEMEFVRARTP